MTNSWLDDDETPAADEKSTGITPWATYSLLGAIGFGFLLQATLCGGVPDSRGTLLALGGLSLRLVEQGEVFRMLTVVFLHLGPAHLLFNALALFLAAPLERVLGTGWFLAIFATSAVGGSVFSMLFNDANQVSVGASGAIMGIFAAQLVTAYARFDAGTDMRKELERRAARILIPTLAAFSGTDGSIDFGAHLGGALAGAALCGVLITRWDAGMPLPPWQRSAWLLNAGAGLCILFAACVFLPLRGCYYYY
jgi:rhomboid protease GluP